MGINKVDQKSLPHTLLTYGVKLWHHVFYYQKVEVSHQDRIPTKGALIFTPNHQNALMDALAILFSLNRPLVFLARADIFKKSFIAEALYFLKILPVFRPRDGHGEVKKNQDTFDKTTEVLKNNLGIGIFPEGNHEGTHSLRTLKKGFARIAFQTEEGNDYNMDIKIIPVGILYSNYQDYKSVLSIVYGHPFSLSKYYDDYKKHPASAYNKVQHDLSEEMKKYMVHIDNDEYYESIDFLQTSFAPQILRKKFDPSKNRIETSQEAIKELKDYQKNIPEKFEQLHKNTLLFLKKSKKLNTTEKYEFVQDNKITAFAESLLFLLLTPVLFIAYAFIIPAFGSSYYISTFIKDPQFKSSIKFGVSLVLFPLFFFIEWVIYNYFFPQQPGYYFIPIYLFSLIICSISGAFVRRFFIRLRLFVFSILKTKDYRELKKKLSQIKSLLH